MSALRMSSRSSVIPPPTANLDFTIEEIRDQLSTLGVTDLTDDQLLRLKRHLDGVIQRDRNTLLPSCRRLSEPNQRNGEGFHNSRSTSVLSNESSTPRVLSGNSASSSPSLMPAQPSLPETNRAWLEPGCLKGTPFVPPEFGSLNSNQIPSQSTLSTGQLLTVPPTRHSSRRVASRSSRYTDSYTSRPLSDLTSSTSSGMQTPEKGTKVPVFVSATTPRIELSVRTASDTTEPVHQVKRSTHRVLSPIKKPLVPATVTNTRSSIDLLEQRLLQAAIKDEGDFEPGSSVIDVNSLETKAVNKWNDDPDPQHLRSKTKPRMTQHPTLPMQQVPSRSHRTNVVPTRITGSKWESGKSVSQKPYTMSVDTASESHSYDTQSERRNPSGIVRTSGRTRHLKVTLPDQMPTSLSATKADSHAGVTLKSKETHSSFSDDLLSHSSDAKLQPGTGHGNWRLNSKRNSNPRIGTSDEQSATESYSARSGTTRRSPRARNQTESKKRSDWTRPQRSSLRTTSGRSPSSSASSSLAAGTKRSGHKNCHEHSGSRSARFPENPVAKVHNWQPRLSNISLGRSDSLTSRSNFSQSTRMSSSSSLRTRRQDPVTRFHSYQRSWLTHLVPGEDARRILRWNIKTAMMHREVPVLQRNLPEVTRLFGPTAAAMLARERQRKLKSLHLDYIPPTERRHFHHRCRVRTMSNNRSGSTCTTVRGN